MAQWSDHPYRFRGHLFLLKPEPVFKARLNLASATYPFQRLPYDTVTLGSYTDIREGMTVLLGSSEGSDDLGRGRVRLTENGIVADSTNIYVGQFSQGTRDGEFDLQDNAYITVLDDYRVWAVLPRITNDGTVYKDFKAPYSWCEPQPPVANCGPGCAKVLESGQTTAAISFDGSNSFAVASGASISSYSWDFVDGTPSTASTAQINDVQFPAGFRWIRLTVTDSNGKSHTAVAPVLVVDPSNPPTGYIRNFEVTEHLITQQGQTLGLRILESVSKTDIPDGTLVLYWEDEYYGSEKVSLGNLTGRNHMKFIGWLDSESMEIASDATGLVRVLAFNCVDVAGRLKQLPGFPLTLERSASANKWTQLKNLNIDRYVWFLLRWHSTALSLADFSWSGTGETYAVTVLGSEGSSLWDQTDGRTQAIAHLLTCDRFGRLAMRPDPQLRDVADRTSSVQLSLSADDITAIRYSFQRTPRIHWLWGEAIQTNTGDVGTEVTPLFCTAPGKAPGQGVQSSQQGEQVVASQTELNKREGHRYAVRHNAEFGNLEIRLAHSGDSGLDPALLSWVQITLTGNLAGWRSRTFSAERFLPIEVRIDRDAGSGSKEITLLLERESWGTPAATYVPPTGDFDTWEDYYPGDYGTETGFEFGEFWFKAGANSIAAFTMNSYLVRTANFQEDPPTWETVFLNFAGEPLLFVVDAFSPGYVGGGSAVNGWILTTQAVYRVGDIFGATPSVTSLYSFGYTLSAPGEDLTLMVGGDASFGRQGHVVFLIPRSSSFYSAYDALWSVDGTNFTRTQLPGGTSNPVLGRGANVYVSSKTAGLVYATIKVDSQGRAAKLLISTNYGATWQISTWDGPRHPLPANLGQGGSMAFNVPYDQNDDERDLYYMKQFDYILYRRRNGVEADITPAGYNRGCRTRWGFMSAPLDRDRLSFVPVQSWNGHLFLSQDGGNSWVRQTALDGNVYQAAIAGDNPNAVYAWGHNWDLVLGFRPRIWYSPNWGATWYDKRGNMETLLTSGNRSIIGICGGPAA